MIDYLAIIRQGLPHAGGVHCQCPGCLGAAAARAGVRVQGRNHTRREKRSS